MDQTRFKEICKTAARALNASATEQDGRCSLAIDGIEVLVDLDEEEEALHCYVDLGNPNSHDRMEVCEQLLALNLHTHSNHHGTYAFEPGSARAIFCADLDAATLTADELAEVLRYYVAETVDARLMIGGVASGHGNVFAGNRA